MYLGDVRLGVTIDFKFTTRSFSTGAPTQLAGSPVISAYVDNGTTQITAGITLTVDFDAVTGLNNVRVVLTGGNGYATGTNIDFVITTGTVGGVSVVGEVVGRVSIENRSALMPTTTGRTLDVSATGEGDANVVQWLGTAAATPTVAGVPEVDVTHWLGTASATPTVAGVPEVDITHIGGAAQSATDLKDFADDGYDPATNKVQGVVLVDTLTTYTGNTVQTGDSFARLGAPAGASVSADVAGVQSDTNDIQTRLPAALVSGRIDASVGAMAAGTVTAAAIATGAIDADALATDAVGEIAAGVWDEDATGHQTQGTFGQAIGDPVADTNTIYKATVTDATGATVGVDVAAVLDDTGTAGVVVASLAANSITASVIATAAIDADAIAADAITDAKVAADVTIASVTGAVGSVTGAVGSVTGNVGGNVVGSVGSLAAQAKTDVNVEVLDVLNTDTFAEPGQEAPGATVSLVKKISYLYKFLRNKKTQTATTLSVFADDGTTVDQKATISDDGTTYTHGEIGTGP